MPNYAGGTFGYSCSTPLPPGQGNLSSDPLLCEDGVHLTSGSPCRGAGTNTVVTGFDIDGQAWGSPPAIGCDEWQPAPVIVFQPTIQLSKYPIRFTLSVYAAGSEPFTCWWFRNGIPIIDGVAYSSAHTTNLICSSIGELADAGYQVVVSNAFGMATSAVAHVAVHCVDASGTNPVAPYVTWATAATNIQDAIAAALPGEIVLVTDGVYADGGKSMDGIITNRVVLDKAITVQSVTGPETTIIQGYWNPTVTNGPAGVRCAWLTNSAVLSGFTLRGGATRGNTGSLDQSMYGGGVWGASTNSVVINCRIVTNTAFYEGGGAYQATLNHCLLAGNHAGAGGGAAACNLNNCIVRDNFADQSEGGGTCRCNLRNCAITGNSSFFYGGGAYRGSLINCTVAGNISAGYGGYGAAVASASLTNCIVYGNQLRGTVFTQTNYYNCTFAYSDSDPLPAGVGNIGQDPQLLVDGIHLAESSPCRGAGTNLALATDIDGQLWSTPPAMGCDEWQPVPVVAVPPQLGIDLDTRSLSLFGASAGHEPMSWSWRKDGNLLQDGAHYASSGTSNLVVLNFDVPDAGAYFL